MASLVERARRSRCTLFRITGAEPILGEASLSHLAHVITGIRRKIRGASFVVETNGFMLGSRPELVGRIPRANVQVRVALKGVEKASFERISGAHAEFFPSPLRAIRALQERGIPVWAAIMGDLHTTEDLRLLRRRMQAEGIHCELEVETLERYPCVVRSLQARGFVATGRLRPG